MDREERRKRIYREVRYGEFSRCDHVWIVSKEDRDILSENTYQYCGCIKCGLNERVLDCYDRDLLSFEDQVIYDYLSFCNLNSLPGMRSDLVCDLDLARAIYLKVRERYPSVGDDRLLWYVGAALNSIRNVDVSEDRKADRAKRLALRLDFDKWNV